MGSPSFSFGKTGYEVLGTGSRHGRLPASRGRHPKFASATLGNPTATATRRERNATCPSLPEENDPRGFMKAASTPFRRVEFRRASKCVPEFLPVNREPRIGRLQILPD